MSHWLQGMQWPGISARCVICHAWPSAPVCDRCLSKYLQTQARCLRCGLIGDFPDKICGTCLKNPPIWQRCTCLTDYLYPWSQLIRQAKFSSDMAALSALAYVAKQHVDLDKAVQAADIIIPVPASPQSMLNRGFNTPQQILKNTNKMRFEFLQISPALNSDAAPQHTLKRNERLNKRINPYIANPMQGLYGKRILICDDVMTTGDTLHQASLAILELKPAQLDILCFSRTQNKNPHT